MVMRNSTEKPCPSRKDVVLSSYVCTGHNLLLLGKVWKKSVSGLDWRDLGKAGTDTAIFKAYSVRGAAATAAQMQESPQVTYQMQQIGVHKLCFRNSTISLPETQSLG